MLKRNEERRGSEVFEAVATATAVNEFSESTSSLESSGSGSSRRKRTRPKSITHLALGLQLSVTASILCGGGGGGDPRGVVPRSVGSTISMAFQPTYPVSVRSYSGAGTIIRSQTDDPFQLHVSSKNGKVWEGEDNKDPNLLRLAELSLKDYEWRSAYFDQQEADRKVEESVARLMGDEPSYVRPMDASETKIGPLGQWEKSSVDWLRQVIDEEGQRAKEIVRLGGILVRPMDIAKLQQESGTSSVPGPLAILEKRFVDVLDRIRDSERQRSKLMVVRPKDMDESMRGPLGEAERRASEAIREILQSEITRAEQSRARDGIVRPIDVPGPLGEFELAVLDVVRAEEARAREARTDPDKQGALGTIRPMNAKQKGPLGELEEKAMEAVTRLTDEEKERLRNIQKFLAESRPMEQDKNSLLGIVETVFVGIVRAPILIYQIATRVKDLLESEMLEEEDSEILEKASKK